MRFPGAEVVPSRVRGRVGGTVGEPTSKHVPLACDHDAMDALGVLLFMAAILWTITTAWVGTGDAAPVAMSLWGAALAVGAGRTAARIHPALAPGAVVGACLTVVALDPVAAITARPTGGVLGYPNARAALFVVAWGAALMIIGVAGRPVIRIACIGAAVVFLWAIIASGSLAGMIGATVIAIVALAAGRAPAAHLVLVCAAVASVVLASTVAIGVLYQPGRSGPIERLASATVSARRAALWHEALDLVAARPFFGVGPGRFQFESRTARGDRDARWAHDGFLQQGAETGIVGLGLLIAIVAWGFVSLGTRPGPARTGPIAAATLAAFAAGASVDYLMHFPAITATLAVIVGAGIAPRRAR